MSAARIDRAVRRRAGVEAVGARRVIILKTPEEIELMRRAGQLTARTLEVVAAAVGPGVTGDGLNRLAEEFIRDHGGTPSFKGYRGFPASICLSVDDEVVHAIPGRRPLREGSIVKVDLGAYLDGFHGDTTRTVPVGEVDPESLRLIRVTEAALQAGLRQAREGLRMGDLAAAIQRVVEEAGFSVVRDYAGHGVGRSLHEEPQVPNFGSPGTGLRLRTGMTLAVEPMVNAGGFEVRTDPDGWTVRTRDGRRSAQAEHTVAVGPGGPDVLTALDGSAPVRPSGLPSGGLSEPSPV